MFAIRVKREAEGCDFTCASQTCTVKDTMIRDQLIIGTSDATLRQRALAEEWKQADLVAKGKSIEAANKGAALLKSKEIKQEPQEVRKTKGGKFSKKGRRRESANKSSSRCKYCNSSSCKDRKTCPARKSPCFACQNIGHYRGAEVCEMTKKEDEGKKKSRPQFAPSDSVSSRVSMFEKSMLHKKEKNISLQIPADHNILF